MMRLVRCLAALAPLALLIPASASAQVGEPAGSSFDVGLDSPGLPFVSLDRADSEGRVGVDVGYLLLEGADFPDAVYRLDLHGQFILSQTPANYLGGYGGIPIAWVSIDGVDDELGIGAAEVGAFYGLRLPTGELVLRGGLTLPTGDDDDGVFANVIAGVARITDFAQTVPRATILRAAGSWLGQSDQIFYRFDGGLDIPLFDISDDFEIDRSPLLRLNAGVGIGNPNMAGLIELANVVDTDTLGDDVGDAALHVLGLAFRGGNESIGYHAGLYFPIDDDFSAFVDLIFSLGLHARL
jgi:hypothetical protein